MRMNMAENQILAKLHNIDFKAVSLTVYAPIPDRRDKMLSIYKTVFKTFALTYFPRKDNLPNNVRILEVSEM